MEKIGALKVTDVGGSTPMISLWKNYFASKKGIIFVFDSYDSARYIASKNVLHQNILNQKALKGVPLLIYSNKSDLSKIRDKQQVIKLLDLERIKGRAYHIECVCAIDLDHQHDPDAFNQCNQDTLHILDGYQWITEQIVKPTMSPSATLSPRKWTAFPTMTRSQSLLSPRSVRSNRSSSATEAVTNRNGDHRGNVGTEGEHDHSSHHGLFHDFHLNFSLRSTKSVPESASTPSPAPMTPDHRNSRKSSSLGSLMETLKSLNASTHSIDTVRLKTHSNSINPFHIGDRKKKMCPKRKGLQIQQSASTDALFHSMPITSSSMMPSFRRQQSPGLKAMNKVDDCTVFLFMFGLSGCGKTTILYQMKYGHYYEIARSDKDNLYDTVQFMEYKGINTAVVECDPFKSGHKLTQNPIIQNHSDKINALMFVIDGNDNSKFNEIRTMLTHCPLLKEDNQIPLLLVVNKKYGIKKRKTQSVSRTEVISKLNGLFTSHEVRLTVRDLSSIKQIYEDLLIPDKIFKVILHYLPSTQCLRFKGGRECAIHFVDGFTGDGMIDAMEWVFRNAKTTHSSRLHIALKMASAKKSSLSRERQNALVFHGDEGHPKHESAHDYLDELMAQIDAETLDIDEVNASASSASSRNGLNGYNYNHRNRKSMPSPVVSGNLAPPVSPALKSIDLNRSLPSIVNEVGYVSPPIKKHIW